MKKLIQKKYKVFDTSTEEGLKAAEKYKARLENKYDKVTTTPVGLNRVRIEWQAEKAQTAGTSITSLAEKLDPQRLGYSPKMAAIIGAIIGHDYGARDRKGGQLTSIAITSDGFVTAASTASDGGGAFIGDVTEFNSNLTRLLKDAELTSEQWKEFGELWSKNVSDWRGR